MPATDAGLESNEHGVGTERLVFDERQGCRGPIPAPIRVRRSLLGREMCVARVSCRSSAARRFQPPAVCGATRRLSARPHRRRRHPRARAVACPRTISVSSSRNRPLTSVGRTVASGFIPNQWDVNIANRIGAEVHAGPCLDCRILVQDLVDASFVEVVKAVARDDRSVEIPTEQTRHSHEARQAGRKGDSCHHGHRCGHQH